MWKNLVQKLPFVIRYVSDQYKAEKMWDKVGTLIFVSDCYKNPKKGNKAVDNYAHALESVSNCCKTQKCVIKLLILVLL